MEISTETRADGHVSTQAEDGCARAEHRGLEQARPHSPETEASLPSP